MCQLEIKISKRKIKKLHSPPLQAVTFSDLVSNSSQGRDQEAPAKCCFFLLQAVEPHLSQGNLGFYVGGFLSLPLSLGPFSPSLPPPLFTYCFKQIREQSLCETAPVSLPSQSVHCHFPGAQTITYPPQWFGRLALNRHHATSYVILVSTNRCQLEVIFQTSILLTFQQLDCHKVRARTI